jgi:flagellar basal-body rod protein FlgF
MDRLIYPAMSGMRSSQVRERVIASNMANAQTIGFRAEMLQAAPVTLEGDQIEVRAMTSTGVQGASMKDGTVKETGGPLDVALQGDTMLAVQAADGAEVYTRRGDLSISATGLLANGEGLPVLGDGGPITVPPGLAVTIAPDGAVMASDPATRGEAPVQIDRLKLVSRLGSQIEKDLQGQFRVAGGGVLPVDAEARVIPGSLEESNVNPTEVLVEMISAQRLFDMRTKLVETARELDEGSSRLMRLDG